MALRTVRRFDGRPYVMTFEFNESGGAKCVGWGEGKIRN